MYFCADKIILTMRIIGTGSAHPKRTLTNDDLSQMMDTSDAWIRERTGICTRQIITDEELDDLAAEAAQKALDNAGIAASELDYIICSNVVNEYVTPSIASIVEGSSMDGTDAQVYDLIVAVDNVKVVDYGTLRAELAKHSVGDTITLKLLRSNQRTGEVTTHYVEVTLKEQTAE